MTREKLNQLMAADSNLRDYKGKNRILLGLNIIAKYIPNPDISPEHDIIYVADADELVEAGLTEEDANELRKMNWMIDSEYGCLAIFT